MLTHDEAMDELTTVSVKDALQELERHGHKTYIEGNDIYAEVELVSKGDVIVEDSFVARIYDGEVYTLEVMQWLGY